jgi:purine-binding chemotaxis protein CheW
MRPASGPITGPAGPAQLSTFVVDRYLFGVEVAMVQEVIRHQPMTRVPLAPPALSGLVNLRGQVIAAVDLRRRLGFPDRAAGDLPMDVVVRTKDGLASLLVDRVGDVVEVSEEAFEALPETLVGVARALVRGACRLDDALLLWLDAQGAVELQPAG